MRAGALRAAVILVLAGCSEYPTAPGQQFTPPEDPVLIAPDSIDLGLIGELAVLRAGGPLSFAASTTWESRDPAVARPVAAGGSTAALPGSTLLEAVGEGGTWIVALRGGAVVDSVHARVRLLPGSGTERHRFAVAVGVRSRASLAALRPQIEEHFRILNAEFDRPRAHRRPIEWVLDSLFVFTDSIPPQAFARSARSADLLVLFYESGGTTHTGFYGPPCECVAIGSRLANVDGTSRILVHEVGHARGAIDLYPFPVSSQANPVSGLAFTMPPSIMNSASHTWSAFTRDLLERGGAAWPVKTFGWTAAEFPPLISLRLMDSRGAPVGGARSTLHRFSQGELVRSGRAAEGYTDHEGTFTPAENPFHRPPFRPTGYGCAYVRCVDVLHAEVEHDGGRAFAWLPVTDVVRFGWTYPGEPYVWRLRLP